MKNELIEFLKLRDFVLSGPDYTTCRQQFYWPRLVKFNWALDYFDHIARDNPNTALIYADEAGNEKRASFEEMRQRSNQVANFLIDLGLKKGDRVLVMMDHAVELHQIFLGIMKAGGVIIPVSTLLSPDDVLDRVTGAGIKFAFAHREYLDKFAKVTSLTAKISVGTPSASQPDSWIDFATVSKFGTEFNPPFITYSTDELCSFFTSGTTARPKLVVHTHNYPVGHLTTTYWIGCKKGDIHYNISAPGWAKYTWSSFFAPWNAEATIFVYRYKRFVARDVLSMMEKYRVTTLCAPLSVWKLFLVEDLSSFRFSFRQLVSAGEPLNPEILRQVKEKLGLDLREGYGQTESTLMIGNFIGEPIREGSLGKVAPGYNIVPVNDLLEPVKPGEDGQLAVEIYPVKPLGLLFALSDPAKNAEVFKGGYYLTGDTATVDQDGYFQFIGRTDDVFKSLDYRISPFEVESELMEHPAVLEVAVVPTIDERQRIVPKAFIVLKPGFEPGRAMAVEIFRFIHERMAPYKRPRTIEFMREFPKTISAKVMRKDLKAYDQELKNKGIRGEFEFKEAEFAAELDLSRK
ncbi:AMP-binding protein [candidate division WOR-3 bacterium]|nr:AMP-binding protein [candidate division WOR-3 bacterium]